MEAAAIIGRIVDPDQIDEAGNAQPPGHLADPLAPGEEDVAHVGEMHRQIREVPLEHARELLSLIQSKPARV